MDAFFVELNTLCLEEILHGGLSHLAVVSEAVCLDATLHLDQVVMSASNLVFGKLTHSLNEVFVSSIKDDNATREDRLVLNVLIKARLLTFWKLFFIFFNRLTIFIELNHFLEECVLCSLIGSGVSVKDVTTVAAVVLAKFQLEQLVKEFVGHSDLMVLDDNLGPAILRFFQVSSLLIDLFFHGSFDFFKFGSAVINEFIFSSGLLVNCSHAENFIYELTHVHSRTVVVLGELLSIESFATSRGTGDKDLHGVEATESVEFLLEVSDVFPDAELCVPLELVVSLQLFNFFWLEICRLRL